MSDPIQAFKLFEAGEYAAAEQSARAALAAGESAALLHLLGVLQCRRNALDEAIVALERALALEPANPNIRVHLVRALIDSGRAAEGLAHARIPAPGPAAEMLWQSRAEAATAAGALEDAFVARRHADLATTERLLGAAPGEPALLLRRGRLLGTLQRDSEAEAVYRQLLETDTTNVEVIAELGQLHDRNNRLDALAVLLADADAGGVTDISLAYLRALDAWRRRALDDASSWLAKADPARDPLRVFALAAKVADARGDYPAAAAAIMAKTAAVPDRDRWRSSAAEMRESMRDFAAAITPDWAARFVPARLGERSPPAFLLGFPRSGTTLLDTFLMGHPEVRVLEEIPLMGYVADALGPLARLADIDDGEADRLRAIYFQQLDRHVGPDFGGLVVDKMPINTLCAPLIHRLFPSSKIIFAQRHPCDCVLSGLIQNFAMNPAMANFLDPADAADFYDVTLDIWTRSEQCLPLSAFTLTYENLVADAAPVLRQLADFLGLEWSDELVDHRRAAHARDRITTASYDQVAEPLNTRSVGRWRHYESLLKPALPALLQWADRLGYGR
ncbi:MAG: sulfotransferase [Sphingomonas sp.]|nr:sulfotransferase [Sphingomonas sp.]